MTLVDDALQIIKQAQDAESNNRVREAIKLYTEAAKLLMRSSKLENPDVSAHRVKQARSIFQIADNLEEKLRNQEEAEEKKSDTLLLTNDVNKHDIPIDARTGKQKLPIDIVQEKSLSGDNRKEVAVPEDVNLKNTPEEQIFLDEMGIDNINIPDISFDDVVGLDMVKDEVKVKILLPMIKKDLAKVYDISAGGGILMYGPPGNGKTFIARAIAHEARAYFININPSNLLNQWFGKFEKNIEKLFKYASKHSPAVLFFDEIDAITPKRSKTNSSYMKRAVPALLSEMDGIVARKHTLLVIGATNNPWDIDEAFLRPGRFGERIYIPPPDVKAREILFQMYLKNAIHDELDYEYFSNITENFSAADIKYVCDKAKEKVFKEVTKTDVVRNITEEDVLESIDASKPSVNNEMLAKYINFRDS
jgi:transitional endoplasmic reticulum ATPase